MEFHLRRFNLIRLQVFDSKLLPLQIMLGRSEEGVDGRSLVNFEVTRRQRAVARKKLGIIKLKKSQLSSGKRGEIQYHGHQIRKRSPQLSLFKEKAPVRF